MKLLSFTAKSVTFIWLNRALVSMWLRERKGVRSSASKLVVSKNWGEKTRDNENFFSYAIDDAKHNEAVKLME